MLIAMFTNNYTSHAIHNSVLKIGTSGTCHMSGKYKYDKMCIHVIR